MSLGAQMAGYLPLVEAIAFRMKAGPLSWADPGDLLAWGLIGLHAAARSISPASPTFTRRAFLRIRTAMWDGAVAALRELEGKRLAS